MKLHLNKLVIMMILATTISSCKKDDNSTPVFDESISAEIQTTDDISMDLFAQVTLATEKQTVLKGTAATTVATQALQTQGSCEAVVTLMTDGNAWPKRVKIDFGAGCTNDKGITHKGLIIADFTRPWYEKDAEVKLTLDHFFIDSVQIDGTKEFISHGINNGTYSYTVKVDKATITNNGTATWSSERTITFNTSDFSVTANGWVKGTTKKGVEYEANTTKDLVKEVLCRYISEGAVEIKAGGAAATVDYGKKGDCDDDATLSINGHSKAIKIRR